MLTLSAIVHHDHALISALLLTPLLACWVALVRVALVSIGGVRQASFVLAALSYSVIWQAAIDSLSTHRHGAASSRVAKSSIRATRCAT